MVLPKRDREGADDGRFTEPPQSRAECPLQSASELPQGRGDLHVENFGTWRDVEGGLVWCMNDFDEVCRMPYTIDLVRLAKRAPGRRGHAQGHHCRLGRVAREH
jgi:hypothetical protein